MHLRGLRDFINMLKEKYSNEMIFLQGLHKVSQSNLAITTLESLYEGIKGFKNDMHNQSNYLFEFCQEIQEEMIHPSEKLLARFTEQLSKMNIEMNQLEKDYLSSIDQTDKFRQRFHITAKEAEINMLRTEANKLNLTMPQDIKQKNDKKTQDSLKIAKEMEKAYILAIEHSNELRDDYIELKKNCLTICQEMEEEIGELIKDSLRKYVVFQVSYLRNMQYDIERKAKVSFD